MKYLSINMIVENPSQPLERRRVSSQKVLNSSFLSKLTPISRRSNLKYVY